MGIHQSVNASNMCSHWQICICIHVDIFIHRCLNGRFCIVYKYRHRTLIECACMFHCHIIRIRTNSVPLNGPCKYTYKPMHTHMQQQQCYTNISTLICSPFGCINTTLTSTTLAHHLCARTFYTIALHCKFFFFSMCRNRAVLSFAMSCMNLD